MNIKELEGTEFDTFDDFKAFVLGEMQEQPREKKQKTVALAYPAFVNDFKERFEKFAVIRDPKEVKDFDLIIFSGGEDVNPNLYGQDNKFSYGVNKKRDEIEKLIFNEAEKQGKKILGVCRGHQLINVLKGGQLYQDFLIEGAENGLMPHASYHSLQWQTHNSIVMKFYRDTPVTSMHHQAVRRSPLKVTATYGNVYEVCESKNIITVQFHPEFQSDRATTEFFKFIEWEW
jgi:gamma-glutamyl-gamma-aminobutyrate hydrolase PuuD